MLFKYKVVSDAIEYISCSNLCFFHIGLNKLIGYADDSTLIAAVPFREARVAAVDSLNRDLGMVSELSDL